MYLNIEIKLSLELKLMIYVYTNEILDLGQFFQRLEKEAGISKINQLKVTPSEKIFESVSIDSFKNMGSKIFKSLRVALLQ